ncbi:MAG: SH3 domain-containing protein, partial [Anaerolineae bacterium]|nr:SH3 domain-containing protein [Anaerolineae bacterium]
PPPQTPYAASSQPAPVPQPRRARRPAQPPPTPPSASGLYLPWWSLVLLVLIVGGVAVGLTFVFAALSEPQTPGDQPPRIQIITSQPTLSQDFGVGADTNQSQDNFWPTSIPQAQPTATVPLPTPVPSPSLPPGNFVIGARVVVVGVENSGLNVRSAPGLVGSQLFLAGDGEVFAIVDGPQSADNLEWWKIEDPNDPSRAGWAARNYLTVQ